MDVPRALTARGWFSDGELVLDVDDPFLGEHGRYPADRPGRQG
jgi:hypothetical protein